MHSNLSEIIIEVKQKAEQRNEKTRSLKTAAVHNLITLAL